MSDTPEETVEVPVKLLADLVYHFDVTSNIQVIPSRVISPLAELAPHPDSSLIKAIRYIAADPEMSDNRIESIISAVRRFDS